jgi:hypothetical protein
MTLNTPENDSDYYFNYQCIFFAIRGKSAGSLTRIRRDPGDKVPAPRAQVRASRSSTVLATT